ncbi:glycosyltransferase [Luteimonas dalianensis]|uniref:glycosyltransferase n=1 Tax=Luteimonas dalianensis TaxID=1148196 RepID=UPI003BF040BB
MTDDLPLVTFALLAYNQENYVTEAVNGALSQRYPKLQIILSDDASADRTFELMQEAMSRYDGPHEVILRQNKKNEGIGAHVNCIMQIAKGEIIIAAAGDDVSLPDRTSRTVDAFISSDEPVYSVWSRAAYIDDQGSVLQREFPGNTDGYTEKSMVRNRLPVIGATHAWRNEVFEFFGPLMSDVMFEDNAISFRSYLLGAVKFLDETLVRYRTHMDNLTNFAAGKDLLSVYKAAARRNRWALTGLAQRRRDLELATRSANSFSRDGRVLRRELDWLERRISRRLRAYEGFPDTPWELAVYALSDAEIAKVMLRSLKHRSS